MDITAAPPYLRPRIRALDTYAALGAPADSIRGIANALRAMPTAAVRPFHPMDLVRRALRIGFPSYQDSAVRQLARDGDILASLETAWLDHDTAAVRGGVARVRDRPDLEPQDRQLEGLYPTVWLLASIGDPGGALDFLAPTLDSQSRSAAETLRSPVAAGMLLRAMVLRARLANQLGRKAEAAEWAHAVATLWADADDPLRPVVKEMKRLSR